MENITDNYKEHQFHNIYDPKCSTCYSNALKIPVGERVSLLIDNQVDSEEEPHPCRWCGNPTTNIECAECDKKNDEAYFERHG